MLDVYLSFAGGADAKFCSVYFAGALANDPFVRVGVAHAQEIQ